MKKIHKILCYSALLLFVAANLCGAERPFTVVLDPGHGGRDPGAVGSFSYEKDIVLAVGLKVRDLINAKNNDIKVIMTREDDSFVELFKRAEIANRNAADLFISIHTNASSSRQANGTETFVMGLHRTQGNLEVAKLENAVILKEEGYEERYGGFDPNDPESHIIFSLFQNAHLEQSLFMAQLVQNNFEGNLSLTNRGVKQAGFLVLWKTTMPSVLVEVGFISNLRDEQYLNTEEAQNIIAKSIYDGIVKYKTYYEDDRIDLDKDEMEEIFAEVIDHTEKVEVEKTKPEPTDSKSEESEADLDKEKYIDKDRQDKLDLITDALSSEKETVKTEPDYLEESLPESKIVFKVQIASTARKVETTPENFKSHNNVNVYFLDNLYRYTIGEETDFFKINELRSKLIKDFPDCFVVAFINGERIPLNEALRINNK